MSNRSISETSRLPDAQGKFERLYPGGNHSDSKADGCASADKQHIARPIVSLPTSPTDTASDAAIFLAARSASNILCWLTIAMHFISTVAKCCTSYSALSASLARLFEKLRMFLRGIDGAPENGEKAVCQTRSPSAAWPRIIGVPAQLNNAKLLLFAMNPSSLGIVRSTSLPSSAVESLIGRSRAPGAADWAILMRTVSSAARADRLGATFSASFAPCIPQVSNGKVVRIQLLHSSQKWL